MKTLAYKVMFRLDGGGSYEKIYNEGFVVVFINENNEFIKMEGLLTNDYLIAEVIENDLVITIYSSYDIWCIRSPKDFEMLRPIAEKELEVFWEGAVDIDDVSFPLELEFEQEYPASVIHDEYKYEDEDEEDEDEYDEEDDDMAQLIEYGDNLELEYVTEKASLRTTEKIVQSSEIGQCLQMLVNFKNVNVLAGEEWS